MHVTGLRYVPFLFLKKCGEGGEHEDSSVKLEPYFLYVRSVCFAKDWQVQTCKCRFMYLVRLVLKHQ